MTDLLNSLVKTIIDEEKLILDKLALEEHLSKQIRTLEGRKKFAQSFYFVRHSFCHLNFIVGERCGTNEFLWAGIARNLYEELGGKSGKSHDRLYQDFLSSIGCQPETSLRQPEFAQRFNSTLEAYCRKAPLEEALSAIAIYEVFDIPDYQLLLQVVKKTGIPQRGLHFFQVHAVASHFEMFEDTISWLRKQEEGLTAFNRAKEFIFHTQTEMWCGLIEHLQE